MATHSSVLVWRVPGMEEPGGLPSMGSHRVGHDWSDLAAAAAACITATRRQCSCIPWERPTQGRCLQARPPKMWWASQTCIGGQGNGTPLQYSCLENPMDKGAWWAAVHGVARSQRWLSNFTFTFHFHALEKEMTTHSSVLAWRTPGTGEPGGLPSMESHRVGHDWSDLAAAKCIGESVA